MRSPFRGPASAGILDRPTGFHLGLRSDFGATPERQVLTVTLGRRTTNDCAGVDRHLCCVDFWAVHRHCVDSPRAPVNFMWREKGSPGKRHGDRGRLDVPRHLHLHGRNHCFRGIRWIGVFDGMEGVRVLLAVPRRLLVEATSSRFLILWGIGTRATRFDFWRSGARLIHACRGHSRRRGGLRFSWKCRLRPVLVGSGHRAVLRSEYERHHPHPSNTC